MPILYKTNSKMKVGSYLYDYYNGKRNELSRKNHTRY